MNTKTKRIAILLVLSLLLQVCILAYANTEPSPEEVAQSQQQLNIGDANSDGKPNAADALLVLQYSVGKIQRFPVSSDDTLQKAILFKVDVSGDGKVDAVDALMILQAAVGKITLSPLMLMPISFTENSLAFEGYTHLGARLITNSEELTAVEALSDAMKALFADFDFKNHDLLLFTDQVMAAIDVLQVAQNGNNLLVRYRYTEATLGMQLNAITIPKGMHNPDAGGAMYLLQEGELPFSDTAYMFTFDTSAQEGLGERWENGRSAIARSVQEESALLQELIALGWDKVDPAFEAFAERHEQTDFFTDKVVAYFYDYDLHRRNLSYYIAGVEKADGVATVYLSYSNGLMQTNTDTPEPTPVGYTAMVVAVELDAADLEGCTQVIFKNA